MCSVVRNRYIYTHKYRVLSGIYIFTVYHIAEYILIKRADNINILPNIGLAHIGKHYGKCEKYGN